MNNKLRALVARWTFNSFRRHALELGANDIRCVKLSFSQHGEDLLLLEHLLWLRREKRGIYIDAGCYDPFEFSNTRLLHLHGWRGINVDAGRDVIAKFLRHRPTDHNVCAALSGSPRTMVLSGRVGAATRRLVTAPDFGEGSERVTTTTLREILESSPLGGEPVDLLDIDCENLDFEILRTFPFERVRPALISIEAHTREEFEKIREFLVEFDYFRVGTRGPTHIFRDRHTVPHDAPPNTRFAEI